MRKQLISDQCADPAQPPLLRPHQEFRRGILSALPLLIGVMPFGIVFGTLATTAGFSPAETALMSATVFAGSAQFLAVGLFAANAAPLAIVMGTLIINLRHLLYGVTLGQLYRGLPQRWLIPLAFTLIDEVFVLAQSRSRTFTTVAPHTTQIHWYTLGLASVLYSCWQIATWLGIMGGAMIPDPRQLGLDFALAATFVAFLIPQLRTRPMWLCTTVAALSALALRDLPLQSGLIGAILLGVAAALLAEWIWPARLRDQISGSPSQAQGNSL